MDELLTWLRAQIAAKRARAEAASPGPWHANPEHDEVLAVDGITVCEGFALSGNQLRATVDFIADNNPAAVLAQCAAHTAILDQFNWRFSDPVVWDPILLALALAYQHNPGYHEEWRP